MDEEKTLANKKEEQDQQYNLEKRKFNIRRKILNLKGYLLGMGTTPLKKKPVVSPELLKFLPKHQLTIIRRSNEFDDVIERVNNIVSAMPKTYETDNIKSKDKIVQLHYFYGNMDWYVVEKDSEPQQLQAYGYVIMGGPGEWGYINIEELVNSGKIELDFYFEPQKFGEISSEMETGGEVTDEIYTKDGVKLNRKSDKNKGHIFYDESGNKFKCLGHNEKLDDCVYLNMQTQKEVVGCLKGFYYNNPLQMAHGGGIESKSTFRANRSPLLKYANF